MATITKEKCRVAYTISGNSPEVATAPEGAGCSHKEGAVLFLSASARLRPLPTANISRPDIGHGIAGLAISDGASYTNSTTLVRYTVANTDTVFVSNIASRFTVATATLALQYRGSCAAGSINASRFYVSVRMVAATNSLVKIKDFVDSVGDTYGRVYFQFLRTCQAFR